MKPRTLPEKVWDSHVVYSAPGEPDLLYIDLHMVHEVTSPQAFESLRLSGRKVKHPELTLATMDHNVPTTGLQFGITDPVSKAQIEALKTNCHDFGIPLYGMGDIRQGIVHVIGPELGLTQPGMTVVCGDSHTSTHGAFGALAFGIGTSEVEHVLATQCLWQQRPKTMAIEVNGELPPGVTAKDIILGIIERIGVSGGNGYIVEYRGSTIQALSMEERMTICNMSIEAGARAGMIAPDDTTFAFIEGREHAPKGADWEKAVEYWRTLPTDEGATFDRTVSIDASDLAPYVTWGTNPSQSVKVTGVIPNPKDATSETERDGVVRALKYMGLEPDVPITDVKIDTVFIGSCTNGRIGDLRAAAKVLKGRKIASNVTGIVVPGSMQVKSQAEKEGLDKVFTEAGLEWRDAGCSMCLGMNPDILQPGKRAASTSNRNFEGRQGPGGRTHLLSPAMAAAAAVAGHFVDIRELEDK